MTQPDSGEYLRARTIRNVENPMKPDSGERDEVKCEHGFVGRCPAPPRPKPPEGIRIPTDLAQRILAALEIHELTALAAELRAIVERKP